VSATTNQVFFGDRIDFEGVVSLYSPVLFRVAFRRLRNVEDAEDAVQDALLSAHKCIGQFQGRSKLSTWLTRIVTNTALMKLRRHSRYQMLSLGQDPENEGVTFANDLMDGGPNPEAIYAKTEMNETLGRALEHLSPKQRAAIQLCDLEGISIREAADALGISFNTMKSRVARARASLNLILGEAITMRHATETTTFANRKRTPYRERRSPSNRGAAVDAFVIEQRLPVCTTSYVKASHDNRISNHGKMHDKRSEIHIPPQSLEMATLHSPLSYAT
jgi:RNA polymerase sigma-70 factor, ECF subfamily